MLFIAKISNQSHVLGKKTRSGVPKINTMLLNEMFQNSRLDTQKWVNINVKILTKNKGRVKENMFSVMTTFDSDVKI